MEHTLFDPAVPTADIGIAFDLGTERTGWCLVVNDEIQTALVIAAKRTPPAKRDRSTAAAQTAGEYALVCEMASAIRHKLTNYRPAWVAVENIYFGKNNPRTHEILAGLKFAVILWCYENQKPFYQATTAEIDRACGLPSGRRRDARKALTTRFAKSLGFYLPQDANDAICVAWWARGQRRLDVLVEETRDGGQQAE